MSDSKKTKKLSLAVTYPEVAKQWHPTKNGNLTPEDVVAGSHKKVWWQCQKDLSHKWNAAIRERVNGCNCPYCSNKSVCSSNCLSTTNPELATEWHPTKNGNLMPKDVVAGSGKKIWWQCQKDPSHEWKTSIVKRMHGDSCPYCSNKLVCLSNSLAVTNPKLAAEWHPTKNGNLTPNEITEGSGKKVWWQCQKDPSHEWKTSIEKRFRTDCPYCCNRLTCSSNCLAMTNPELAIEWHPIKNGDLTPNNITAGSHKKVWWQCLKDPSHQWEAVIKSRTFGRKCPYCTNRLVCSSNCLATTNPELAAEWHLIKNGNLTPKDVVAGSHEKVWWQCLKDPRHEWIVSCGERASGRGCPLCNSGWTVEKLRLFVRDLLPYIQVLDPVILYVLFQKQDGLFDMRGKGKSFVQALKTGKFPLDELEKFANEEPSLVDDFLADKNIFLSEDQDIRAEKEILDETCDLPVIETKKILSSLDKWITPSFDKETVEFFINYAVAKIWQHAFVDEIEALRQLKIYNDDGVYAEKVKNHFLTVYNGAKNLEIPKGYAFRFDGKLCLPNLMQRFTAFMIQKSKRFGNWSDTGSGKTLSAILASQVIDARLTIICCPNSVVDGWKKAIKEIYPDSVVATKDTRISISQNQHHYVVLNYEFFQQPRAEIALKKLLKNKIDFIVIDEIHLSKQRVVEDMSKRRRVIAGMLSEAAVINEDLHVLGMSATPVINNLFEGKTLIELVTGVKHDELNTRPTVDNCIALFKKFVSNGVRYLPKYDQTLDVKTIEVDCSLFLEEIKGVCTRRLGNSVVDLEAVLTKAKIPEIIAHLKPKTIVYTYYVKNILIPLQEAIEQAGWKTAIYSGEDKTGLEKFLHGNADVLIATSCIDTGVDGLQNVCSRIIMATLPWTYANFKQLKGRVYRQGQKSDHVDIIVPLTYAMVNGKRWSWCADRWKRIHFKKSIADSAVDGVIPEGHLRTPAQALKDAILWLERLERGEVYEIERRPIFIPLSDDVRASTLRKLGDLSQMNQKINHASSEETHVRFQQNPDEWECYHSTYREDRKNWDVVPYQEVIKWANLRPDMVIGDFGCGENFLAQELENQVHSFDHVAINDGVIACDMAHVPLEDECLDAAVFSLSLMGTNYVDYLREARRCLKLDGHLWIAEPTSRIKDPALFKELLERLGFKMLGSFEQKWKFTFIEALKSDREINEIALQCLLQERALK